MSCAVRGCPSRRLLEGSNTRLEQDNEALRAEISWLKGELGISRDLAQVERLKDAFKLRGHYEAKLLSRLASGKALTKVQLADELQAETDPKCVDVYIHRIRTCIGFDAIKTLRGHGFQITEAGLARVMAVLEPQELAA